MLNVDVKRLREEGYLLVEDLVSAHQLQAVVDLICEYMQVPADRTDPDFKRQRGEVFNGIVPLHQHQALWDARQSPKVHEAFSQIYDTPKLWVTIDRVSYKPKLSTRSTAKKGDANSIHVDRPVLDTSDSSVQGILYLSDTEEDQGAFECIPEIYRDIVAGRRTGVERGETFEKHDIHRVPGPAGSMVIWDGNMPHSSGHNWTDTPRFVQYITMHPEGDEATRQERIQNWQDRRAPTRWRNMLNQEDPEPWTEPASLTSLGEQLLGSRAWD